MTRTEARAAYQALMKYYPLTLDNLDGEEWRNVPGYEGCYQVSTFGRIKSFARYPKGKILKPVINSGGYLHVELCKNRAGKFFGINRLVAQAFIPNPKTKPQVDHIDGHPMNNHVSNLRWATSSENTIFAYELGLASHAQGGDWHAAKLTNEQAQYIRENPDGLTGVVLAEIFNIAQSTISNIQLGKTYRNVSGQVRRERKIPDEIRGKIRLEYKRDVFGCGQDALAKKYGISATTIRRIVNEV